MLKEFKDQTNTKTQIKYESKNETKDHLNLDLILLNERQVNQPGNIQESDIKNTNNILNSKISINNKHLIYSNSEKQTIEKSTIQQPQITNNLIHERIEKNTKSTLSNHNEMKFCQSN